ncbi:hypothetical protein EON80_01580 [bacterium]|nr:MAG: hypothetical protein EON80_01580 [bacterium]
MIDFTGRFGNDASVVWLGLLANATLWGIIFIGAAYLLCFFSQKWLSPNIRAWVWRLTMLKVVLCLIPFTPLSLKLLPPQPEASSLLERREISMATFTDSGATEMAPARSPIDNPQSSVATPVVSLASFDWALLLIGAWAVGAGISTLRLLQSWLWTQQLRRSPELRDDTTHSLLQEVCDRLRVSQKPRLGLSNAAGPLLIGAVSPIIVLPDSSHARWSRSELRLILAHEVAHHKRADLRWNLLMVIAGVILWFHPLMWLAHREWRASSEQACDELTLRSTQAQPASYGALLVQLASGNAPVHSLLNVGVADDFHLLKGRLMQFRNTTRASKRTHVVGGLIVGMGVLALMPWRLVAQEQVAAQIEATADSYAGDTFASRVVDDKGTPVANAKVFFIYGGSVRATGVTDAGGAFALKNASLTFDPEYDMKMLVVDAGLQGMAKRWVGRPGKVQPMVLEAPFSASFRFVDPAGKPLRNMVVKLPHQEGMNKNNNGPWVWLPPSILERYTGKTNDEGLVTFQGLPQYNLPTYALLTGGDNPLSAEDAARLNKPEPPRVTTINNKVTPPPRLTGNFDTTIVGTTNSQPTEYRIVLGEITRHASISIADYSKPNSPLATKTIRTTRPERVREIFPEEPPIVMGAPASGKVLNPDGSAATDVRLMINGTAAFTFTDQDGKFQFPEAPNGNFVIGVTRKSTPTAFIGHLETTEHSDLVVQIKQPVVPKTPPRLDPDH